MMLHFWLALGAGAELAFVKLVKMGKRERKLVTIYEPVALEPSAKLLIMNKLQLLPFPGTHSQL